MAFRYEVTISGRDDIDSTLQWLSRASEEAAGAWAAGLVAHFRSLCGFPMAFPLAPEADVSGRPIRQSVYGNKRQGFRVLFEVRNKVVYILHVRRDTRTTLQASELGEIPDGGSPH